MAVFRVNKSKNYTVMSNMHLRDKSLSLKAKGLLSIMFSLPEDWDYSIRGLVAICKEGESAVSSGLDELKAAGYLRITKVPPTPGTNQFSYIYDVFEEPLEGDCLGVENLGLEVLGVENHGQLSTKEQSTDLPKKEKKRAVPRKDAITQVIEEYTDDPTLRDSIVAYVKMRKQTKHALTEDGLKLVLKKLSNLANTDMEKAAVLDQSTMNSWRGIFAVKGSARYDSGGDYSEYN